MRGCMNSRNDVEGTVHNAVLICRMSGYHRKRKRRHIAASPALTQLLGRAVQTLKRLDPSTSPSLYLLATAQLGR